MLNTRKAIALLTYIPEKRSHPNNPTLEKRSLSTNHIAEKQSHSQPASPKSDRSLNLHTRNAIAPPQPNTQKAIAPTTKHQKSDTFGKLR